MKANGSLGRRGLWVICAGALPGCLLPDYDLNLASAGSAGSSSSSSGGSAAGIGGGTTVVTASAGASAASPSTIGTSGNAQGGTSNEGTGAAGETTGSIQGGASGAVGESHAAAGAPPAGGANSNDMGGASAHLGGNASGGVTEPSEAGTSAVGEAGMTGVAGSGTLPPKPCPVGRGPVMISVPEGYCIDTTEVTEGQYAAWLSTNPAATTTNQIAVCSENDDFESARIRGNDNYPVVGVDWCDAVAFCTWAGKRLCGRIGGGAVEYYDGNGKASESEWFNACTSHGTHAFPYGDTEIESRCNGGLAGLSTVAPVGDLQGCTSAVPGYEGIFDMAGNVMEWVNSCSDAANYCRVVGGSYLRDQNYAYTLQPRRCDWIGYEYRDIDWEDVGFRCCAD